MFDTVRNAEYTSAGKLASLYGVTSRTVRSDIVKINDLLPADSAHIAMKRGLGYYLVIDNEEAYRAFLEQEGQAEADQPDLSSADDRIRFLLHTLLEADDYLPSSQLADMVYVGENTMQNYIHQLRSILVAYDLALIAQPGIGLKVFGREVDRRRCYMEKVVVRDMRGYVTGFSSTERALFPAIDLELLERIVRQQLSSCQVETSDYGLKNLLMHCALMITRIQAGHGAEGSANLDISPHLRNFLDELCSDLGRSFGVVIPDAERSYLCRHVMLNGSLGDTDETTQLLASKVDEMLELIYRNYGFDLRDDIELKQNLLTHLVSVFASRNVSMTSKNPLLNTIRTNFPLAFEIALTSTHRVFSEEPYAMTEDEVGYVALHIGAAIQRRSPASLARKRVLIVCGAGKAIAEMLRTRIETLFGDKLDVARIVSYREFVSLAQDDLAGISIVVSTVPLEHCPVPYALVDFSLGAQDTEAISRLVNGAGAGGDSRIADFFDPRLFVRLPGGKDQNKEAVIALLCELLEWQGFTGGDFLPSVLEREAISDTSMTRNFAIPHPLKPISEATKVAVAVLDEPIVWSESSPDMRIVFLLAVRAGERANIEHLYDLLIEITGNRQLQQGIMAAGSFEELMTTLASAV